MSRLARVLKTIFRYQGTGQNTLAPLQPQHHSTTNRQASNIVIYLITSFYRLPIKGQYNVSPLQTTLSGRLVWPEDPPMF